MYDARSRTMTVSATTAIGGVSRMPSYYRARYYNPTTGRFLSEDPMGFAGSGTNLYAYASNNPMRFRDPFGTCNQDNQDPLFSQKCNGALMSVLMSMIFLIALMSVFIWFFPEILTLFAEVIVEDLAFLGDGGMALTMLMIGLLVAPGLALGYSWKEAFKNCE
jgi:RHS repeat-associated protein